MTSETKAQWSEQAKAAILQGQSLTDFIAHCHADNRRAARRAYLAVKQSLTTEAEIEASRNSWDSENYLWASRQRFNR